MISTMKTAALAGVLALAAGSASAITLEPGQTYRGGQSLSSGETLSFSFDFAQPLEISSIVIGGTGFDQGNALSAVSFGLNGSTTQAFDGWMDQLFFTVAKGNLAGGTFSDSFEITFASSSEGLRDVLVGYEFTTAVAAVPVPAAGLLLLTALIGGGAAARTRKKNA